VTPSAPARLQNGSNRISRACRDAAPGTVKVVDI